MKKDFWIERWERGEIGFHQDEVNPYLLRHWQDLHLTRGSKVFVPLCGKSRDMHWLHKQGHPVLGVELSAIAVQAFFKDCSHIPHVTANDKFDLYEADGISIRCGDFFDLRKDHLAGISAVYDRASLVALPMETRKVYVRHLVDILPPATPILLITFDYPQHEMSGPPFAVPATEIEDLFGGHADIHLLSRHDVLVQNPRFQERGLSRLQESVFLLAPRKG